MIPQYGPDKFKGVWYGVALSDGEASETVFNSKSLRRCEVFARRVMGLTDALVTIDEWARSRRDGLAWWLHTIEHVR